MSTQISLTIRELTPPEFPLILPLIEKHNQNPAEGITAAVGRVDSEGLPLHCRFRK